MTSLSNFVGTGVPDCPILCTAFTNNIGIKITYLTFFLRYFLDAKKVTKESTKERGVPIPLSPLTLSS